MYKVIIDNQTIEVSNKDEAIELYCKNYKTANSLKIIQPNGKIMCKKL